MLAPWQTVDIFAISSASQHKKTQPFARTAHGNFAIVFVSAIEVGGGEDYTPEEFANLYHRQFGWGGW